MATLKEILEMIEAPKGITSILAGISVGDYSVIPHQKGIDASYQYCVNQIEHFQKQMDECKSDWSYWSILGDLEYWKAVKNIMDGARLVGENNMPDIKFDKSKAIVVMDSISLLSNFGMLVLKECKNRAEGEK